VTVFQSFIWPIQEFGYVNFLVLWWTAYRFLVRWVDYFYRGVMPFE
jgi:hypothetical protein